MGKTINAGESFDLSDDEAILQLKSPQKYLDGPYKVVCKSVKERWAIVAMHWEKTPVLGIRWFWDTSGYPVSRSCATWFVLPPSPTQHILSGDCKFSAEVNDFLTGKITGEELK